MCVCKKFKNRQNFGGRSYNSDCSWVLEGRVWYLEEVWQREPLGFWDVLYLDLGGCYTDEYIWKLIKLYSLRIMHITVCVLYLNKKENKFLIHIMKYVFACKIISSSGKINKRLKMYWILN